jgi:hypothetical protein
MWAISLGVDGASFYEYITFGSMGAPYGFASANVNQAKIELIYVVCEREMVCVA